MFKAFLFTLSTLASMSATGQVKMSIDSAATHIGDSVTICDVVVEGKFVEGSQTAPTLLSLGGQFPNQKLTVAIGFANRNKFKEKPEQFYLNKTICVTGKLVEYAGKPQIEIIGESQIQLARGDTLNSPGGKKSVLNEDASSPDGGTQATFPGGRSEELRYFASNLNVRVAPAGVMYKVAVKFVVGANGKITNVEVLQNAKGCPECDLEAVRVIKRMPKWNPATKNGQAVPYEEIQNVTFHNSN